MLQNVTSVAFEIGEFVIFTDIFDQLKRAIGRREVRFNWPDVLCTQDSMVWHEKMQEFVVRSIECI